MIGKKQGGTRSVASGGRNYSERDHLARGLGVTETPTSLQNGKIVLGQA
jgi:hypothetical protein